MSVIFALWCVASGVYTGFLCVRKGLNAIRNVTKRLTVLNTQIKNVDAANEVKDHVQ